MLCSDASYNIDFKLIVYINGMNNTRQLLDDIIKIVIVSQAKKKK